ncbi:MAG: TetR/AcrR family transcriptional regulator [Chitinophagaceae bacterium]|nr:TetR/AcrR family transcriptional regulator [Chitinophagaceae bacterium]
MSTAKKDHIITTAIELFAEKGFEGSSIRDLATRADVNVAMVNYYFGSKDKLFEAIVEHKAAFMRGKLDEIAANPKLDELEKMNLVIENYVEKVLSQPSFHKILYQELLRAERQTMHDNIIRIFVKNTQTVREIIEQGIKKKIFRKVDPQLTVASMMGTINQVMLSKAMCAMLLEGNKSFSPYTDPAFKTRLIKHIKQVMHAHLLQK